MPTDQNKKPLIKFCLMAGSITHLAGLIVYERFPFLYLVSIVVLSAGFFLHLQGKQYDPMRMPSFWGMVIVLSIPIAGLIAGFQKMLMTPAKTSTEKPDRKRTTLVTLLLAVPIAVLFAAMIIPAFSKAPSYIMKSILITAGAAELALLMALFAFKKRSRKPDDGAIITKTNLRLHD